MRKSYLILFMMMVLFSMSVSALTVTLNTTYLPNGTISTSNSIVHSITTYGSTSTYLCRLYTNENGTNGIGDWRNIQTDSGVVNNTSTNFSTRTSVSDTVGGNVYIWNVFCNGTGQIDVWAVINITNTLDQKVLNQGSTNSTTKGKISSGNIQIINATSGTDYDLNNFTIDYFSGTIQITAASNLGNGTLYNITYNYSDGTGYYYGVDTVSPTASIIGLDNNDWDTDGVINLSLSVVDENAGQCVLGTNLNRTSNNSGTFNKNYQTLSYTNNTKFDFTGLNSSNVFADKSTSVYLWHYSCNDTAGNSVALSSNYTFFVDSVSPAVWQCEQSGSLYMSHANVSTGNDITPQVTWNASSDTNFSMYRWFVNNTNNKQTYDFNISSASTVGYNVTLNYTVEATYKWYGVAYDLAGNVRNASNCIRGSSAWTYTTDITCSNLSSGWNICGNLDNSKTLSQLLNETGGTTVSYFNSSHRFQSHVAGGDNGGVSVPGGEPFLVFKSSAGVWEGQVWNTSAYSTMVNITNHSTTNTNWNLVINMNSTTSFTMRDLDLYVNGNITHLSFNTTAGPIPNATFFTFYNNSAATTAKYVSFRSNKTFNNFTSIGFGEVIWIYHSGGSHVSNDTTLNKSYSMIDWAKIK